MKSEPGVCAEGPNDAWKQGRAEERLEDKDMGYRGRGYERGRGEERELKEEEWEVIRAMRERGSMGMGGGPFIYNPVIYGPQGQPPIPSQPRPRPPRRDRDEDRDDDHEHEHHHHPHNAGPGVYSPRPGAYEFGRSNVTTDLAIQKFFTPEEDGMYLLYVGLVSKTASTYSVQAAMTWTNPDTTSGSYAPTASLATPGIEGSTGSLSAGTPTFLPGGVDVFIQTSGGPYTAGSFNEYFSAQLLCDCRPAHPDDDDDDDDDDDE